MDAIESIEVSRDLELYNNQQKKIDEISKFQEKNPHVKRYSFSTDGYWYFA